MISTVESNCTACSACYSVCPYNAINFNFNNHGFLVPIINEEICKECGLCEKVCPQINSLEQENLEKTYAFINLNDNERKSSTSGGFFIIAAKMVLESGGYVCGCILKDMKPIHITTNNIEDVKLMHGSKYVQSDINDCFIRISNLLTQSVPILFSGTSCQVAGLKKYLITKKINTSLLICVDFLCHGVPSSKLWNDYVNYYEEAFKRKAIDYKFRSKKYGWGHTALGGDHFSYFVYKNSREKPTKIDDKIYYSRIWRSIFFSNLCLREVCFNCKYSSLKKPADITMADFWGVEEILPEIDDGKGCSLIVCNSKLGNNFIKKIKNAKIITVDKQNAISKQVNAHHASLANEKKNEFWYDYCNKGFKFVLRNYFRYNTVCKIKGFIKRILFKLRLRYLY